ncbi:uncharacterized protein GBIM_21619, partial [Gryllus bimaculatus]
VKRYYDFKLKHWDLYREMYPSSVKAVFDQDLVTTLPLRDEKGRRVLILELGSKSLDRQLQRFDRKPLPRTKHVCGKTRYVSSSGGS